MTRLNDKYIIKFRGVDKATRRFVYGLPESDNKEGIITHIRVWFDEINSYFSVEIDPDTVSQYTNCNMKKNGQEIYVGDCIHSGLYHVVKFDNVECAFVGSYDHWEDPEENLLCHINDGYIVGNIYGENDGNSNDLEVSEDEV